MHDESGTHDRLYPYDDGSAHRRGEQLDREHAMGDPFAAAIRRTRMPIVISDPRQPDNPIVFCNDAFVALTGYPRSEIIGRNCRFLQGKDTDPTAVAAMAAALRNDQPVVQVEILNYRKDGTTFWNSLFISSVEDETGDTLYHLASQQDITERKLRELAVRGEADALEALVELRTIELQKTVADLKAVSAAKTILLHEVDHRVKNNLQMIASLILLQAKRIPDASVRAALQSMLERVEALSIVHRRLYQSDDVSRFDISEFARDLATNLIGLTGRDDIALDLDLETVEIDADKAAPLALMINEILTNSVKHAFSNASGTLSVRIKRADETFLIEIADDGIGIPTDGLDTQSFGQTVIRALARQLQAELDVVPGNPGTRIVVRLPIEFAELETRI